MRGEESRFSLDLVVGFGSLNRILKVTLPAAGRLMQVLRACLARGIAA